ncbi:hypothetical protein SAMN05216199_1607 [Pedococcus cremeus]|uniref:Uncharacterized protein n=1 Tax=Pedococcus cremeus TaxID=587636 RepID=A0A1H9TGB8_9MICO|nr:hypothetical protein [Pedococcus cremeus]SER96380.1 hypothetical protein SAMN05216199_1607 [Pedococcus cremeus]
MSTLRTRLARLHRPRRARTAHSRSAVTHAVSRSAGHSPSAEPSHAISPVLTGLR